MDRRRRTRHSLWLMNNSERVVCGVAGAISGYLVVYWFLILSVDGQEGSFTTTALDRGRCFQPFQLYGQVCRQWAIVPTSTLLWEVCLACIVTMTLVFAAVWRRSLPVLVVLPPAIILTAPSRISFICAVALFTCVFMTAKRMRLLKPDSSSD